MIPSLLKNLPGEFMGKPVRIIIIGGVAAGASAAARARRLNEDAEIKIIEKSTYVSFANCGMPYHIGGEITNRQRLLLNTPDSLKARFNIDVYVNHEVIEIDRKAKNITVRDLTSRKKKLTFEYDKLLIATGARHIELPIDGIDAKNVFPLRHISNMDKIKHYIETYNPMTAVVLGAGYIGVELAEQLKRVGIEVTMVEKYDQVMPVLDPEMATVVEEHIIDSAIKVIKNDGVVEIITEGDETPVGVALRLESGREIRAELILMCIGITPEVTLAKEAKLKLGETGAIVVNDKMQTSDKSIFAAGDAVESRHRVTSKSVWMPLAGPANMQGRVAGTVMAGGTATYTGVIGTSIVKITNMAVAKTGLSEKETAEANMDYFVSFSHSPDHAMYYPGATMQHIKLIVENKTGRLLGAQVIGNERVDKAIDIFATVIGLGGNVDDLVNMDLAYAPPFSTVKSPALMAGMIAQNRLNGLDETIMADEVINDDYHVIDVRTASEHESDVVFEESELITVDNLRENIPVQHKGKKIALLCRAGLRSYIAYRMLKQHGFKKVKNINGGYLTSKYALKKDKK